MYAAQDPLINYVVNNVWCAPYQDTQAIFKPARLTGYLGAQGSWKILMTHTYLPDSTSRFHLFQMGYYHPSLIALLPKTQVWTRMSTSCETLNGIIDVYFANGVRTITSECWYKVTEESNLIFAVRQIDQIGVWGGVKKVHMGRDDVFFRIYRNAYFQNPARPIPDGIQYRSAIITANDDVVAMQVNWTAMDSKPGVIYAFRNGYRIDRVSLITCKIGDWVETIYDPSIHSVVDLPLKSLPVFDSVLDQKGKYLVHPRDVLENTIRYHDDVDMFLLGPSNSVGDVDGVYLHKNTPNAMRMLTQQDYSIPVQMVSAMLEANACGILNFNTATLRLHLRDSGFRRPLVDESQRLKELYKLPPGKILSAMVGLDATVDAWKASNLEAGAYVKAMSDPQGFGLNREGCTRALGYNAVTKLLADPLRLTETFSGQLVCRLGVGQTDNSTCFEYDAAGLLLGYHRQVAGSLYNCTSENAKYVEIFRGSYSDSFDEQFCKSGLALSPSVDWRHYVCEKNTSVQVWKDVTGDSSRYLVSATGIITWTCSDTHYTISRSNKTPLVYSKTLSMADGILAFMITQTRVVNGVAIQLPVEVPCGELEIILNGWTLILGLDYHVDWPRVMIVNKHYLKAGDQDVVIRAAGLCNKDLSFTDANEFGFVINGRLSVDRQYDVRDDKVLRVNLGGHLRRKEELLFNETTGLFEHSAADNGRPYQIKDYVVPLKDYTGLDTPDFRTPSVAADIAIGRYTTERLTQPTPDQINPILGLHRLYSPFLSKLIMDLISGVLILPGINGQYSNDEVLAWVRPYEAWMEYDPISPEIRPDINYTIIDPHCFATPVSLSVVQYAFVNRVMRLYAPWMKLSTHATVI